MRQKYTLGLLVSLGLLLAACSGTTSEPNENVPLATATSDMAQSEPAPATTYPTLEDNQGEITVVVKPLNLDNPTETLDFEVTLDTHSVDLDMDLTTLATLTTDKGQSVTPSQWDAPQGGHHVSGVLFFPAEAEGAALLADTSQLTLRLRDVDVPERVFTWDIVN